MAWFSAMRGSTGTAGKKSVLPDLKCITARVGRGSEVEIPADLLASVTQASQNEDDRRDIMQHLRECLAETSGKNWQRVYSAMMLLEALVKSGSSDLMKETAEGRHFDIVQRLAFLEVFNIADKCVQGMVRTKAMTLRKEVITALESVDLTEKKAEVDEAEIESTLSPESTENSIGSAGSASTACVGSADALNGSSCISTVGIGSDENLQGGCNQVHSCKGYAPNLTKGMTLNNVVKIGHSDDTTSESECGEGSLNSTPHASKSQKKSARERNERSKIGKAPALEEPVASVVQPPLVDLLDF